MFNGTKCVGTLLNKALVHHYKGFIITVHHYTWLIIANGQHELDYTCKTHRIISEVYIIAFRK